LSEHRAGEGSEAVEPVARIDGVNPEQTERRVRAVLEAQAERWGAPLLNHLIYARRPEIFRGARAMWGGLEASGLLDPRLVALVNRRVAALNGCVF
jgi:alkylhydroperoxidase family enzyme